MSAALGAVRYFRAVGARFVLQPDLRPHRAARPGRRDLRVLTGAVNTKEVVLQTSRSLYQNDNPQ
jgi:2-keto-3-deoxy-6-phosphogluconate aldolase